MAGARAGATPAPEDPGRGVCMENEADQASPGRATPHPVCRKARTVYSPCRGVRLHSIHQRRSESTIYRKELARVLDAFLSACRRTIYLTDVGPFPVSTVCRELIIPNSFNYCRHIHTSRLYQLRPICHLIIALSPSLTPLALSIPNSQTRHSRPHSANDAGTKHNVRVTSGHAHIMSF